MSHISNHEGIFKIIQSNDHILYKEKETKVQASEINSLRSDNQLKRAGY